MASLADYLVADFSKEDLACIADHAAVLGLLMKSRSLDGFVLAPITLLPCVMPSAAVGQVLGLQLTINQLVDRVSRDIPWLHSVLESVAETDEFTRRLLDISKRLHSEGLLQRKFLGILRSDYMLDSPSGKLLQVEINTISSAFSVLSTKLNTLHRFVLSQYSSHLGESVDSNKLPSVTAFDKIFEGILKAVEAYGTGNVLLVATEDERNIFDQLPYGLEIWKSRNVQMLRGSLEQVYVNARLDDVERLFYLGIEIAVVYYRSGYSPHHYKTEDHWAARELLERSLAIKCPSVDYQLAGSKKLQEAFAIDSELQRFIPEISERQALTKHFAEFLLLEGPSAIDHILKARKNPHDFVLKPQREGGGNNYFDQEIIQQFENFETDPEVQARIKSLTLMQRIKPPVSNSLLFKEGVLHKAQTVSELGVYGVFLSSPDEILVNETAGYLLRTKSEGTNEGGVATGYSVLDTPYLV